jgi:hypothetical protein
VNPGFNIIEEKHYPDEIFDTKIGIIEMLKIVKDEKTLPYEFAVIGLDTLLFYASEPEKIARYINDLLRDKANFLTRKQYIIQVLIRGEIEVIESNDRPRLYYKNKEFLLYDVFGRVKQIRSKHFLAPLNLQS